VTVRGDEPVGSAEIADWRDDPWDPVEQAPVEDFEPLPRQRRWMRWVVYGAAAFALVAIVAVGAVGLWYARQVNPPGAPGVALNVVVDPGMNVSQLANRLQTEGIITNARVFRFYIKRRGGLKLQPGYYTIRKHESMGRIAAILETPPSQTFTKVTFPEGFTLRLMAKRLANIVPRLNETDFLAAAATGDIRSRYEPAEVKNLEGLLFPDTYQVAANETADSVVRRMVGLMDRVAAQQGIDEAPDRLGVTPYQVLVIASIIEREAKVDVDRGKIARVIYNRLRDGEALQIDATVLYGAPDGTTSLTKELIDTLDSPYNTYKVAGLPPTPIAMPGKASIRAALNPTVGDWKFYVLIDADGHHAFANTLAEHEANVATARAKGLVP
jgi:UPF0755 protein